MDPVTIAWIFGGVAVGFSALTSAIAALWFRVNKEIDLRMQCWQALSELRSENRYQQRQLDDLARHVNGGPLPPQAGEKRPT